MKYALILLFIVQVSTPAYGAPKASSSASGLFFTEAILPYYWKTNNAGSVEDERTYLGTETGLGYMITDWAYLGGTLHYTYVKTKLVLQRGSDTRHEYTYNFYGPSFGYVGEEFMIIFNYFIFAEQKDLATTDGDSSTTSRTGSGYGLNIAYRFNWWNIQAGPMLSYKNISYTNCKDPNSGATSTCNPTVMQSELTPYFIFVVNFH